MGWGEPADCRVSVWRVCTLPSVWRGSVVGVWLSPCRTYLDVVWCEALQAGAQDGEGHDGRGHLLPLASEALGR